MKYTPSYRHTGRLTVSENSEKPFPCIASPLFPNGLLGIYSEAHPSVALNVLCGLFNEGETREGASWNEILEFMMEEKGFPRDMRRGLCLLPNWGARSLLPGGHSPLSESPRVFLQLDFQQDKEDPRISRRKDLMIMQDRSALVGETIFFNGIAAMTRILPVPLKIRHEAKTGAGMAPWDVEGAESAVLLKVKLNKRSSGINLYTAVAKKYSGEKKTKNPKTSDFKPIDDTFENEAGKIVKEALLHEVHLLITALGSEDVNGAHLWPEVNASPSVPRGRGRPWFIADKQNVHDTEKNILAKLLKELARDAIIAAYGADGFEGGALETNVVNLWNTGSIILTEIRSTEPFWKTATNRDAMKEKAAEAHRLFSEATESLKAGTAYDIFEATGIMISKKTLSDVCFTTTLSNADPMKRCYMRGAIITMTDSVVAESAHSTLKSHRRIQTVISIGKKKP